MSRSVVYCCRVPGSSGFVDVVGMEVDKMDENEWKYHGEGNKSLVVSHVQVTE